MATDVFDNTRNIPITEFTPGNEVARAQLDALIDQLQKELRLAEEGLANYAQEVGRLREFLSGFKELLDLDAENHPGTDLGRLMLEVGEYLRESAGHPGGNP